MIYEYNNKINYFDLFFEHSFDFKDVYLDMNLISYKKKLSDSRLLFLEVKDKLLYSSVNPNNFFRYDLYLIKMYEVKQIVNDCKFLIYMYDGINEYNNIYLDIINYFHQTGFKIPIWLFSRNIKMKYKNFFFIVPDDTTFGNFKYKYNYKNNLKHYGISVQGLSKMMYFQINKKILTINNYIACPKLGHLSNFHSELNNKKIAFSPRYILFCNYIENIDLYVAEFNLFLFQDSEKYCQYDIILDGIGSTYPSYIYKLISNSIITKIADNDYRFEYNIIWEQWFFPNFKQNIDFLPIYSKILPNNNQFLNNIIINSDELKLSKKIILNEQIIDEYFIFMINKWSEKIIQTDYKYIEERLIHKEYLSLIPFKKYDLINLNEDFNTYVKIDHINIEIHEYFIY